MKAEPSRTINELHFTDLDPMRFEVLCESLVYRLAKWQRINHMGVLGSDDGVDIEAEEEIANGYKRTWYIQCKRYSKFSKKDVDLVFRPLIKNRKIPDTLLLIVGCKVSAKTIEFFINKANEHDIKNPKIWTSSDIETQLFTKHHDLLFIFFGIDLNHQERKKEESIRRNLRLKKNLKKDLTKPINTSKKWFVNDKFIYDEIIIHSIDDTSYPNSDSFEYGISSWFKTYPYDFYYNGLEVILGVEYAEVVEDGRIRLLEYNKYAEIKNNQNVIRVYRIGRIPFSMIVDYDPDGDEYYNCLHLYCNYGFNSSPYEKIIYRVILEEENVHSYPEVDLI